DLPVSYSVTLHKHACPAASNVSRGSSRGSVSLGTWVGFAFLVAVLCELCGKEELNREERQGFAKDAKQVRGLALRSWRQSGASFAVRRISPRRTPRIRKGRKAMVRGFGFAFLVAVLCELCGKEELNREERQGFAKDAKQCTWVWLCVLGGSSLRALR